VQAAVAMLREETKLAREAIARVLAPLTAMPPAGAL
jgi:hypothetical protein